MPKQFSAKQRAQWKENIINQQQSGLSIAAWCRQNNIQDYTFYYWQTKLFPKETLKRSSFTELPENNLNKFKQCEPKILIDYHRVHFQLDSNSDATLKLILNELKELMC